MLLGAGVPAVLMLTAEEPVEEELVEDVEDEELFENAIRGMLTGLDPHSSFLDEDALTDLRTSTTGEFGGLGIEVGMENDVIKVISPIDDTPAARAGVKAGDLILKELSYLIKEETDKFDNLEFYKFPSDIYCITNVKNDKNEFLKVIKNILEFSYKKVFNFNQYEIDIRLTAGISFSNKANYIYESHISLRLLHLSIKASI